jgi:hypothetical protein
MKATLVSIFIASFAAIVMTQSGPTALNMTYAEARGIVASQGALARRTGSTTYDRYIWESELLRAPRSRPSGLGQNS